MLKKNFAHLHLHTKYSVRDGAIMIDKLAQKCANNDITACAITDHGNGYGLVEFYETMKANNIKPILGYESYTTNNDHLVILAMNNDGYSNLLRIISYENMEGFVKGGKFAKGNLDLDWVAQHGLGKNIIATTACLGGTTSKLIMEGKYNEAKAYVNKLKTIFTEVYIELQDNTTKDQALVNLELQRLAQDTHLPLVLTKDAHYLNKEDYEAHDALLALQINKPIDDPNRWRFPGGPDYYVATPTEMQQFVLANNIPEEAYNNTTAIADKCDVCLFDEKDDTGTVVKKGFYGKSLFPDFAVPQGYTQDSYLRRLAMEGLIEFIMSRPSYYKMNVKEYIDRLNYELDIICDMGYSGYFLILWDFMKFCKDYRDVEHPKGIGTGTGRGSGVGSLVCRSLNITKVDPIKYHLLFERFLNPERDSIPDVDLDIADLDRHLVIEYLMNKYTVDRVGQIVTFATVKVGGGTRDLMRLKGYDKKEQDAVCNKIPAKFPNQTDTDLHTLLDISVNPDKYEKKFDNKLPQAIKMSEEFTGAINQYPWILKQMDTLEGCVKSTGSHAGGVLIFPDDARNYAPFTKATGAAVVPVCHFEMHIIELIRALKIDVLGLTTSRIISRTANKVNIDIDNIDYEDDKVFDMLRNGFTADVFQFSSGGMTKACIDGRVSSIEDLIAIVSIYRPGPLDAIDGNTGMTIYETYIQACQTGKPTPSHVRLEGILSSSKGNMIYQEQVMQVVMEMGGCSLGYADEIRRACAKKKEKLMNKLGLEFKYGKRKPKIVDGKEEFDPNGDYILKKDGTPVIKGAIHNGFTEHEIDLIWDMIRKFAGYAFNKSHAAAYAVNAYQTAYLKYYYPAEFMAEVLSAKSDQADIESSIKECKRLGVPVLPPDVNKSDEGFIVETLADGRKGLRFGIQAIKGISSAEEIKANRPYTNVDDFFARVNASVINKGKAEALILSGCFDDMEPNRHYVYNHYFGVIRKDNAVDAQTFENLKKAKKHASSYIPKDAKNYQDKHRYNYEADLMGMYVSGHPLDGYPCKPWQTVSTNEQVEYIGILKKVHVNQDRYNRAYAFFKFETKEDILDAVIWANDYAKFGDRVIEGETVIIRGTKKLSRDKTQLVASQVLVNPRVMNKQKNNPQAQAVELNMTPMTNPMDDLYSNNDSVNNILYGQNQVAISTPEPEPQCSDNTFSDLFGGYC